jgi:hypothetical protein
VIVAFSPDASPRPLLILGLSAENVRRLVDEDDPILKHGLDRYGVPCDVLIFAGSTEEQMAELLQREFGAQRINEEDPDGS